MSGTLLLADDSITIQKVVELTFAETEHKVFAVGSGRDLLQRLPEIKPDVVLCDVVMPDMNGYDVCQALKSDPNTLHIPVVLLTGTFEPFDRDRAQAVGCDAIVTKPFEARELIGVVEELLQRIPPAEEPAPAAEEYGPLGPQGIPEGVPSLEFTTTGFEQMVPPPTPAAVPPEDGIELTSSALGDSHPAHPAPAPPELAGPDVSTAVSAPPFAFAETTPHEVPQGSPFAPPAAETPNEPAFGAAPPPAPEPASMPAGAPEPFLVEPARPEATGELFAQKPGPAPEPGFAFGPEPALELEPGPAFAPESSSPAPALAAAPPFSEPPAAAPAALANGAAVAGIAAAVAAPIAAAALSHETLEHIARRAAELIRPAPPAPAPPTAAELLTDEHVERIARRAAELVPAPPPPPTAAELLTDEHVERVARRAAELVPAPAAPPTAAELLTDEHVERVARRAAELVPPPPPPAAAAAELSDEQIDKIARRVVELAAPQLERIAWEVIPDMAEMVVRKRIAELEKAAEEER